jgi:uncharacterized protein YkwD
MQFVRVLLMAAALIAAMPAIAQSQYTLDGTPTGLEEEIRWRVNRGRFDTASENLTRATAYIDVPTTAGPLAPNQEITLSARHQSEDLAKANLFQHETVPNSLYYNPSSQPNPWDRMSAEGYTWNSAGENIAAGYSGSESVYVGWWNSTGHRVNMYNSGLREIGNGYYNLSTSQYRNYYTMDLGASGSTCFFTDTIFHDSNANGTYEQSEAVAGVAIRLQIGSNPASYYDTSTSSGSFAVPIQSIASGAIVQVVLSNTTTSSITLSIPRDYMNYSAVSLGPNESRVYGSFIRSAGPRNFGLRDLTPVAVAQINPPQLTIAASGKSFLLSWNSETSRQYQPQWSTNQIIWTGMTNIFLPGTGGTMSYIDTPSGEGAKWYRLLIRTP